MMINEGLNYFVTQTSGLCQTFGLMENLFCYLLPGAILGKLPTYFVQTHFVNDLKSSR